jgi:hypothetical protein
LRPAFVDIEIDFRVHLVTFGPTALSGLTSAGESRKLAPVQSLCLDLGSDGG